MPDATNALETPWWDRDELVVGVDEVGTGAWVGCCTVGAVVLNPQLPIEGLRDSKALTPERREALDGAIRQAAIAVEVVHVPASDIDQVGLGRALTAGVGQAVSQITASTGVCLLDGTVDRASPAHPNVELVTHGDRLSVSIAAASIVAKVARDRLMVELDREWPAYGLAANKGYPSPDHIAALDEHGPCPQHRRSFRSISQPPMFRL